MPTQINQTPTPKTEKIENPDFRTGFVALIGRPNAGKSCLLNHLLGEKLVAVSPKAQTTRKRFRGIRSDKDSQIIFIDTPGIHRAPTGKKLNEYCVAEALDSMVDADVFVYLVDGSRPFHLKPDSDELFIFEQLKAKFAKKSCPLFILLTKMDVWQKGKAHFTEQDDFANALKELPVTEVFPISAKTGEGVGVFLEKLKALLPTGHALYPEDELTDQSMREIVANLIQEKLFYFLGEELPYSCAVEIEDYQEPKDGKKYPEIRANIHVERDSQKSMVIGKGGSKIKEIGEKAREDIEKIAGSKVVLRLFVKVTPKWTKNVDQLERLGFTVPKR